MNSELHFVYTSSAEYIHDKNSLKNTKDSLLLDLMICMNYIVIYIKESIPLQNMPHLYHLNIIHINPNTTEHMYGIWVGENN